MPKTLGASKLKKRSDMGRETLSSAERNDIIKLWHTSKIPLGSHAKRYDRLLWTTKEFLKAHPDWTNKKAYVLIDRATQV